MGHRVVQDVLNASLHSLGGLGLGIPDRLEDVQHLFRADGAYRLGADLWAGIGLERAYPLMGVFGILPSSLVVRQNILGRATGEGNRLLRFGLDFGTRFDRVDTGFHLLSMLGGFVAGLGQTHVRIAA